MVSIWYKPIWYVELQSTLRCCTPDVIWEFVWCVVYTIYANILCYATYYIGLYHIFIIIFQFKYYIYILIIHIYNIFSVTWISNVGLWDNDYGKWDMIGQKCSGISYPYEAFNIRHKLFYKFHAHVYIYINKRYSRILYHISSW